MPDELDNPSRYRVPLTEYPPTIVVPAVQKLDFQGVIADGAHEDMEFNIDSTPLIDMMLSADRNLTVRAFLRIDESDTFGQIGADVAYVAGDPAYGLIYNGQRYPGSMLRLRIVNASGAAANVRAQAHVRSS